MNSETKAALNVIHDILVELDERLQVLESEEHYEAFKERLMQEVVAESVEPVDERGMFVRVVRSKLVATQEETTDHKFSEDCRDE